MTNIGYATLSVIPSTKGFGAALSASAAPGMASAGAKLGKVFVAGTVVAAAAVATFAVKGVQAFSSFESGMNEVFTLLPGATEQAMGAMSEDTRAFAREMGTTTDDVIPALYQAISAGVPQDNVFDFLEVAQKAAVGGVTELSTAVDGISSVVNAYGEDVIDAGTASDQMFTAVRLGKTNFEELSASLFQVIPTASALGVGFDDVTAGLAAMTAQGVPTSVATTQMRSMLVELSKDGGKTANMFEDLAGKSFKDFISSGGDVNGALDLLGTHAEDSGLGINDLFGSVEAGGAALALFDNAAFTGAMAEMDSSAGATDAAYAQMDQGLSRTWDRVKAQFSDAAIEVGERLAPAVQTAATWFSERLPGALDATFAALEPVAAYISGTVIPAVQSLSDWVTGTGVPALSSFVTWVKQNATTIAVIAGVITTLLLPVLINMGVQHTIAAAKSVVAWVLTQAASVKSSLVQFASHYRVVAGWVASAAAAIASGAQTVAIWTLYKVEALKGAAITVASHARMAGAWLASKAVAVASMAITVASMVAGWVVMGAQALLGAAKIALAWLIALGPVGLVIAAVVALGILIFANLDLIKGWISAAWEWITGITTTVWGAISTFFSELWVTIKTTLTTAWDSILGFFKAIPGKVVAFFMNWSLIGLLIKHWDSIRSRATSVWNGIVDFVKKIPGRFVSGLASIGTTVRSKVSGWVGKIKTSAVEKFTSLVDWVKGLPARIISSLGNLSLLLINAGKNIISGLLNGITDKFNAVKDFVGGIGSWIADHKGPRAYDLALLRPAGGWLIQGLQDGLNAAIPGLERTLAGVSATVAATPLVSPGGLTSPDFASRNNSTLGGRKTEINVTNHYPRAEPTSVTTNRALQYAGAIGD